MTDEDILIKEHVELRKALRELYTAFVFISQCVRRGPEIPLHNNAARQARNTLNSIPKRDAVLLHRGELDD